MSETVDRSQFNDEHKIAKIGPREVRIPKDWEVVPFEEAISVNPSYDKPESGSFDYLPMDAVDEEKQTIEYWKKREKDDCTNTWFKNGDTVYPKITPCTENGKIAFITGVETELGSGSTEFLVFHPREGVTEPRFVYYLANLPDFRSVTISLMEGSTGRQRVPTDVFKKGIQIPLPPLSEQRRIVDIISTVDEQIQQTDKMIVKLEDLREGLSQDLFQEGYFEHSKYKETRIGPITHTCPSTWAEVTLSEITTEITEIDHNMPEKTEEGIPFITAGDVTGEWPPDFSTVERIPKKEYERLKDGFNPEQGDIVYSRFGSGSIGIARKIDFSQPFIASYSVALIKPQEHINVDYLLNLMNYSRFRQAANQLAVGAANTNLNLSEIRDLNLFLPGQDESNKIGELLKCVNNKISSEKSALRTQKDLKRGLIQDLLTGKVRVHSD